MDYLRKKIRALQPKGNLFNLTHKYVKVSKQLDEKILQGCLKREVKSQKAFYDHFSSTMYAVCLRYSNTREDARDILQDGFVKVFAKLEQYTGKGSLEGWMKRVFINTALEHYRVNKNHMYQSDVEEAYQLSYESDTLDKISQKEIFEVMQKMATGYRTILNLYAIEGYSHAEIAEMLNISEGTSKSQLSRARVIFILTWKNLNKENN